MSIYNVNGHWRCRFMIKGERYFINLPNCKTKTQAKAAEEEAKTLARTGKLNATNDCQNFKQFVIEQFLPFVEANKSFGTQQSYRWRCTDLIETFGRFDLSEISTFTVEKFKREQLKRQTKRGETQSPASVNRYLQLLGSILSYAEELELIAGDQRPRIATLREDNHRIRYLTLDEEERLRNAAAPFWPYLCDMIIVDISTGLRREELFGLKKEDVDFNLKVINVLKTKSGKSRRIPIDPNGEAYTILQRLCRESKSEYVFTSPHSGRKFTNVTRSLAAACEEAELEDVTIHTFRHTFGTRLAAAGASIRTIKELMGHRDIKTTERYVHLVESEAHEAIAKLSAYQRNCHKFATTSVAELSAKEA